MHAIWVHCCYRQFVFDQKAPGVNGLKKTPFEMKGVKIACYDPGRDQTINFFKCSPKKLHVVEISFRIKVKSL